jgi:Tol biopolymer transport system component
MPVIVGERHEDVEGRGRERQELVGGWVGRLHSSSIATVDILSKATVEGLPGVDVAAASAVALEPIIPPGAFMALPAGTRFGPYEIVALLGAGGMGEVYRAHDPKLRRDVAIKVLPDAVSTDPDRLRRFEREARALAALNHPNIAAVYAVEDRAIVMELVAGADLSARIRHGPIPLAEALPLARQIADALACAHEAGIIHRDLKPANIKVKEDGTSKVLDFGLAKAFDPPDESAAPAMDSPTVSVRATQMGVILGTASYLAPEQARGRPVDKRADIWAFGVVLYEMLTGVRPFVGEDVTDVLAAVVRAEPDWSALPATTPRLVRRLLAHCLTKDLKLRLHDIADARLEIDEAMTVRVESEPVPPATRLAGRQDWRPRAAAPLAVLSGVLMLIVGWEELRSRHPMEPTDLDAEIPTPGLVTDQAGQFRYFDISRDGRLLAYSLPDVGVMLRPLASPTAGALAGTRGATHLTFSPDGQQIAFYQNERLFRISTTGGARTEVAQASVNAGLNWGDDDYLYFSPGLGSAGIWRVAVGGGRPESVTTVRDADRESAHTWPDVLPGGKAILYTALGPSGGATGSRVVAQVIGSNAPVPLIENAIYGRYLPSGHLLYAKDDGTLYALPFDSKKLKTAGQPAAIQAGVATATWSGGAFVAFSAAGTEIYLARSDRPAYEFLFADRHGQVTATAMNGNVIRRIGPGSSLGSLSPNGMRLALTGRSPGVADIWVASVGSAEPQRLTLDTAEDEFPVWSPTGDEIAYTSADTGTSRRVFVQDARGGGQPRLVRTWPRHVHVSSWSPDGKWLAVYDYTAAHGQDVWLISIDGKDTVVVATGPAIEREGKYSPDGNWLAYVSSETGRPEIFLVSLPSMTVRRQVTTSGGTQPRWDAAGRLYYLSNGGLVVQPVDPRTGVNVGASSTLFSTTAANFELTRDGQRFLLQVPNPRPDYPPFHVRTNWFDEVRAKLK